MARYTATQSPDNCIECGLHMTVSPICYPCFRCVDHCECDIPLDDDYYEDEPLDE